MPAVGQVPAVAAAPEAVLLGDPAGLVVGERRGCACCVLALLDWGPVERNRAEVPVP